MSSHPAAYYLFEETFRAEAARYLEYSFGVSAQRYGTMLSGAGPDFLERVGRFARDTGFSAAWARSQARLSDALAPASYFFKVDWLACEPDAVTLYHRFERGLGDEALASALADTWGGPHPNELAWTLGEASPCIVAQREMAAGDKSTAVYYRLFQRRQAFLGSNLGALLDRLALPEELGAEVGKTLEPLLGFAFPPMMGIDSQPVALKFDVAGVPLAHALRFILRLGACPKRAAELGNTGRSLGLETLNYVGTKFGAGGLEGWKLYMPIRALERLRQPWPRLAVAGGTQLPRTPLEMLPW